MPLRRSLPQLVQITSRRICGPTHRSPLLQRFVSNGSTKLVGPMDNAFNRERLAVKAHAAQSAGMGTRVDFSMEEEAKCLTQICGGNSASSMKRNKTPLQSPAVTLTKSSVVVPALILAALNAKNLWDEHWEHWDHMPPLEERVEYPYMNIRSKAFPWGDGDKVRQYQPNALQQLFANHSCVGHRPFCMYIFLFFLKGNRDIWE